MRHFVCLMLLAVLAACAERAEDRMVEYDARLNACAAAHGADSAGLGWRDCAYSAIEEVFIADAPDPEPYREAIEADRGLTAQLKAGEITREQRIARGERLRERLVEAEVDQAEERERALQAEVRRLWERDKQRRKLDAIREDIDAVRRSLLPTE